MDLKGAALVTGAAKGIGRAIALRLAEDGFDIALNDLEYGKGDLEALSQEISLKHRRTIITLGDVSLEADVRRMVDSTVQDLGSLDVMVANAGIVSVVTPFPDTCWGIFSSFPMVSPYAASKFAVRGLTQSAAKDLGPHKITVNAYAPGFIDTAMLNFFGDGFGGAEEYKADRAKETPVRSIGQPKDIASLVSYLASDESHFITGQSISINGGLYFD